MLIRFSVTNFKVFRDTAVLSMEATKDKRLPENIFAQEGYKGNLLKLSATYGANASGKTTLFHAYQIFLNFIRVSAGHADKIPLNYRPFAFGEDSKMPTSFEAEFIADGIHYVYGFSYDSRSITEEHLYSYPNGKKKTVFERSGTEYVFKSDVRFRRENARRVRAVTLYVSVCAQFNDPDCIRVMNWASQNLVLVGIDTMASLDVLTNELLRDRKFGEIARRAFKIADLGITDVRDRSKSAPIKPDASGTILLPMQDIWVKHEFGGVKKEFPILDESAGTIRFLAIIGYVIEGLRRGWTVVIDEIDMSFHTDLCAWIAGLFLDPGENKKNAQLILNTHDVALLDQSILRRDQIYITSKNWKTGEAELRRLSEYGIRNDLDIRKAYLNGSLGGRPFIAPERLMEDE